MKLFYILQLAWEWQRCHWDMSARANWHEFCRVIQAYQQSWRHYHVLRHISKTVRMARECFKDLAGSHDISVVAMALIYHDVVYVIGSKRNEDDSAMEWRGYATGRFEPRYVDLIDKLIMLTKSHCLPSDAGVLEKIMNDCDMSILAAGEEEYLEYARNVWREYHKVGREAYLAGRLHFLRTLNVEDLFHTGVPSLLLAELNVATEIGLLENHPQRIMVD